MRDERGRRHLFETLPLRRVREALNRGDEPSRRDMEIVTKLAEEYLEKRPKPRGRRSQGWERFPLIYEIEKKKRAGVKVNDAIREVFTSDDGKLDRDKYDTYVTMYEKRNHAKAIRAMERFVSVQESRLELWEKLVSPRDKP